MNADNADTIAQAVHAQAINLAAEVDASEANATMWAGLSSIGALPTDQLAIASRNAMSASTRRVFENTDNQAGSDGGEALEMMIEGVVMEEMDAHGLQGLVLRGVVREAMIRRLLEAVEGALDRRMWLAGRGIHRRGGMGGKFGRGFVKASKIRREWRSWMRNQPGQDEEGPNGGMGGMSTA